MVSSQQPVREDKGTAAALVLPHWSPRRRPCVEASCRRVCCARPGQAHATPASLLGGVPSVFCPLGPTADQARASVSHPGLLPPALADSADSARRGSSDMPTWVSSPGQGPAVPGRCLAI